MPEGEAVLPDARAMIAPQLEDRPSAGRQPTVGRSGGEAVSGGYDEHKVHPVLIPWQTPPLLLQPRPPPPPPPQPTQSYTHAAELRGRYHRLGQVHSLFGFTAVTSAKTVQIQFREMV